MADNGQTFENVIMGNLDLNPGSYSTYGLSICVLDSKYKIIFTSYSFPATIGAFAVGTALAWTSPALPQIESPGCEVDGCDITTIDAADASWIGALMPLGAMFAGPVVGECAHRLHAVAVAKRAKHLP